MILSRLMSMGACKNMNFSVVAVGYLAIGDSLDTSARALLFQNDTDVKIWITDNPLEDQLPLSSGKSLILDISSNKQSDEGFVAARGKQFYVKAYAGLPSLGDIHITPMIDTAD